MNPFLRGMVVPFFAALLPTVWYVNRNLTTAALPPTVDPTPGLIALGLVVAVIGASVVGAIVSLLLPTSAAEPRELAHLRRVLYPPTDALVAFLGCMGLLGAAAAVAFPELGPGWLRTVLLTAAAPLVLPFLLLAPVAIFSHLATVVGLAACPLWCSLLANLAVDYLRP